ncbi:MAG: hypothetical protein WC584_02500 [Candidatus Pacearchaeota archaeon]
MTNCEMLKAGRTEEGYFLGEKRISCPMANDCSYKNGIFGTFGEWEYSLCKTHGQVEQTGRINLDSITQQQSPP